MSTFRSTLYFAFGSNMDEAQMRRRCPSARYVATARLAGHALAFVGRSATWEGGAVATVLPHPDGRVDGVLYRLTEADLAVLDGYEGHPRHYRRQRMKVLTDRGMAAEAHVYVLPGTPGFPSPRYFWVIARAYERLGIDPGPLCAAVRDLEAV